MLNFSVKGNRAVLSPEPSNPASVLAACWRCGKAPSHCGNALRLILKLAYVAASPPKMILSTQLFFFLFFFLTQFYAFTIWHLAPFPRNIKVSRPVTSWPATLSTVNVSTRCKKTITVKIIEKIILAGHQQLKTRLKMFVFATLKYFRLSDKWTFSSKIA